MFAPLKRIMILVTVLMFPAAASAFVSISNVNIDNDVLYGNEGFVVGFHAEVDPGTNWRSTKFNFSGGYTDICVNHDTMSAGDYDLLWYVDFYSSQTANSDHRWMVIDTFNSSNCSSENTYNSVGDYLEVTREFCDGGVECITNFIVTKGFRPLLENQSVNVHISCSAGIPGDDDASLIGDQGVQIFPQIGIDMQDNDHDCVITETTNVPGYTAVYYTSESSLVSTEGCFFYGSGNMREDNYCHIQNIGVPSTFTVTKEWEVFQDDAARFVDLDDLLTRIGAECTNQFVSVHISDEGLCPDDDADSEVNGCFIPREEFIKNESLVVYPVTGDATVTFTVENDNESPVRCMGFERLMLSNVEATESTCNRSRPRPNDIGKHPKGGPPIWFEMDAGESAGCGFVNTVFFEGIPTLSQYGMAIMALLMLGVGFVGFRRFV